MLSAKLTRFKDGRYCLSYYLNGNRRRETFADKQEAQRRSSEMDRLKGKGLQIAAKEEIAVDESARYATDTLTAKGIVKPLTAVVDEYIAAHEAFEKGKLWFAEGFGVWPATDLAPLEIPWQAASEGIEEACIREVIAPPGGRSVAAMMDLGAFYFTDSDTYTAQRLQPTFMATWALDWCAKDPKFLVGIFRNPLNLPPFPKASGFSTDGGITWTRFAAAVNNTLPKDLEYEAMAVSANDPNKIVWMPENKQRPYYTADKGATWQQASLGGPTETGLASMYSGRKPLRADRVLPDTFYFYTSKEGVFRSTDGDKDVFGKVYLGFAQAGLAYGELTNDAAPKVPVSRAPSKN